MNEIHISEKLWAKYLSNQCSCKEVLQVETWINSSFENKKQFEKIKRNWESFDITPRMLYIPSQDLMWSKIEQKIKSAPQIIFTHTRSFVLKAVSIAAIVSFILGFGATLIYSEYQNPSFNISSQKYTVKAPLGQKSQLTLPDGTNVWLNSGTEISYYSDFNLNNRRVELTGEAYFEVNKLKEQHFTVKVDQVDIVVLGTKFNVKSTVKDPDINISLLEGAVDIYSSIDRLKLTDLQPNQKVEINKNGLSYKVCNYDSQMDCLWTQNQLYFNNTPVYELWDNLESWYGVNITIVNANPKQTYRFKLKTESLLELLQLIDKLTPIHWEVNGEDVTVTYK